MQPRYQIRVRDTSGVLVAQIDDYTTINIEHIVNSGGYAAIYLPQDSINAGVFDVDYLVEIWRSVQDEGIDWYMEYIGIHRTTVWQTFENGASLFSEYSEGLCDLVKRRIVAYYSGSDYTDKDGPAETVMKEFVEENCAASATSPPRVQDGVFPNFSVEADRARGDTWSGARAWRNIGDVLKEIADATNMYYDVILASDPGDPIMFTFKVYETQRGTDRRVTGLDPATGLNAAGNAPVVFALEYGNIKTVVYSDNRGEEVNAVFALGQGEGDARMVGYQTDAAAVAASPWNLREASRNANSEKFEDDVLNTALEVLNERKRIIDFNFAVIQTPGYLYGRDYTWGDIVSGKYLTFEQDLMIERSQLVANVDEGEKITLTLRELNE